MPTQPTEIPYKNAQKRDFYCRKATPYKNAQKRDFYCRKPHHQEQTLFEDLRHGYECRKKENLEKNDKSKRKVIKSAKKKIFLNEILRHMERPDKKYKNKKIGQPQIMLGGSGQI